MHAIETGPDVNVRELRGRLVSRLTLAAIIGSALLIWSSLALIGLPAAWDVNIDPLPAVGYVPLLLLLSLALLARVLLDKYPVVSQHLVTWGFIATLAVAMATSDAAWLPFLGIILTFICSVLVSGGGLVATGVVIALVGALVQHGMRVYPLPGLFLALIGGATAVSMTVGALYTALEWAWNMQQRVEQLLEAARDRQGELNRARRSLEISNALLQRTQRELIFARQQEEEARLMKERFAAHVSHEFRTPLNLILGFSEMMHMSPGVYGDIQWSTSLRQDIYQIYSSSRHLMEMINDILDLSRFEMVGFRLYKEPTPIESLVQNAVGIARDLFRGRPVRLEVDLGQNLPTLEIDRTRIRQVVLNLLSNAARFTEQGTVRVAARCAEGQVIVSVSDTGPGVPADEQEHIFEEFYQIDRSLHRRNKGAGLGLAICKRFVKAHEGRIWVESQEGVGSTFSFSLPIPGHYVPASPPYERPATAMPEIHPPVLVVDHDPAVTALIQGHLDGSQAIQVAEASELAEQVDQYHPRAIVYNVRPGNYDSQAIAELECSLPISVPCIVCSIPSQAWLADELHTQSCLSKPVSAQKLLQELDHLEQVREALIIDDDRGFCQLVTRMLQAAGRQIRLRRAYSGERGLAAMRAVRPDVVLLDLVMPGTDGFHVLEEMRANAELASVPVVLLTGAGLAEDVARQRGKQITIHRADGLSLVETLGCLSEAIGVLKPRYDERSVPGRIATKTSL